MTDQLAKPEWLANFKAPEWAVEARGMDDGLAPWFVAPIGRGYFLPGAGQEPHHFTRDDDALTFELVDSSLGGNETDPQSPYIDQIGGGMDGFHAAFASTDTMRRYAQILLEVADDAERLQAGNL